MDEYTEKARDWLDQTFHRSSDDGIYFAHQPIYGFRDPNSADGKLEEYIRSYRILKALSSMRYDTLLDVGGAEGYTAYLVKRVFGKSVRSCDLSEEVCRRAGQIFGIQADAADVHDLPYRDGQFDVVVCSETLEHVTDAGLALDELLRVAGKALIITVPLEKPEVIEENKRTGEMHAHIHSFDSKSFDRLSDLGFPVRTEGVVSSPLVLMYGLIEGRAFNISPARYPGFAVTLYRRSLPFFESVLAPAARAVFKDRTAAAVIRLDGFACRHVPRWKGVIVTAVKDREVLAEGGTEPVTPAMLLGCRVPHHYLGP